MKTGKESLSSLLTLIAIGLSITALYVAREIILPLALAALLSFLLTPLVRRFERWHFGRIASVLIVVVVCFSFLGTVGWVATGHVVSLSQELPGYKDNLIAKIRSLKHNRGAIDEVTETLAEVSKELTAPAEQGDQGNAETKDKDEEKKSLKDLASRWMPWLTSSERADLLDPDRTTAVAVKVVEMPPSPLAQIQTWLGPLVAPLTTAGMVVVLVLFMLVQREDLRNRLIELFGTSNLSATTEAMMDAADRVSRYLRLQFLLNAGYGAAVGIGLYFIGIPNAVLWAVLGFALRFLPYIGPWMAAMMPITIALAVSDGWREPLLAIALFCSLELIVNNVLEPLLYGGRTGISSLGIIVSAIFWTWLWGPIGLVLAMPLTVCLVVVGRYVPQLNFVTVLLSDRQTLALPERIYQRLLAMDYEEALELATSELKGSSLDQVYSEMLIPALRLAERDRHSGVLNDEQESFIEMAPKDLIEELEEVDRDREQTEGTTVDSGQAPKARVLCIPSRDAADETTSLMLGQLLSRVGFHVDYGSYKSLTAELVDQVASSQADIVVVSILPPLTSRDGRYLCKRLRNRFPEMPLFVGIWKGEKYAKAAQRFRADGADEVVYELADTVTKVRAAATRLSLANPRKEGPSVSDSSSERSSHSPPGDRSVPASSSGDDQAMIATSRS